MELDSSQTRRSEVQRAVANHWAEKFAKKTSNDESSGSSILRESSAASAVELVSSTSDESDEELEIIGERHIKRPKVEREEGNHVAWSSPMFSTSRLLKPSPVHIFDTPVLRPPASDSMQTFFNSKLLQETFVFSFQLDVEFITSGMHDFMGTKVNIIAQDLFNVVKTNNVKYINVRDIITNWSCHHSKMVINFYKDDTMQIFISTSNFTPDEYACLGGVYWKSELLVPVEKTGNQEFGDDLCNYLKLYNKLHIDKLAERVGRYDFSEVKASFVGSTPSASSGNFGYLKLHRHLLRRNLFPVTKGSESEKKKVVKILAQTSTIAGPFKVAKEQVSNIFTHLLVPLMLNEQFPLAEPGEEGLYKFLGSLDYEVEPMILFPTIREIFLSRSGARGSGVFIYNNLNKRGVLQDTYLSKFFHKRNPDEYGNYVNNHSKIYMVTEDDFQTLNWCFIGSMNLSKSAWGTPTKDGNLKGNNWECGVLLDPKDFNETGKFVPIFNENKHKGSLTPIRLPFKLPLKKYEFNDKLWCLYDPLLQR